MLLIRLRLSIEATRSNCRCTKLASSTEPRQKSPKNQLHKVTAGRRRHQKRLNVAQIVHNFPRRVAHCANYEVLNGLENMCSPRCFNKVFFTSLASVERSDGTEVCATANNGRDMWRTPRRRKDFRKSLEAENLLPLKPSRLSNSHLVKLWKMNRTSRQTRAIS